jgi:hypothetical protein
LPANWKTRIRFVAADTVTGCESVVPNFEYELAATNAIEPPAAGVATVKHSFAGPPSTEEL